ncbi:TB2/DP1, HVA22 family-domain-containing protein [Fimicolochytrium jonesii]|uniref:TB2/DP1, HVA22 family-domain-containing protein n=1 Tax=Fimicolochytrium jonesii TaxID=1396493 RepID=UPI0022FF03D0|nr:TB2/DP1, HVA22 family-domain-containing protein [Fimicolochytrium jonesii]KAI8820230.1 TB2/DP1, HVA22 family-domain-containing protein [Fimicolochytrium jonesii]
MSLLNRGDDKHRFIKTLVAILRARLLPLVHGTETRAHSNPWLVALWKNLGVPPMSVVALVGVVALAFVRRLMKREPLLLTNLVGVLYPAYQSLKAVERPEPDDDERWLTYWSVFGGFTLLDTQSHKFDKYTRYYYLAKMLALHWLYARSGSLAVYRQVIRPFLVKYGGYGVVHAADPTSINGTAGLVVENPGPFRKDL